MHTKRTSKTNIKKLWGIVLSIVLAGSIAARCGDKSSVSSNLDTVVQSEVGAMVEV